MPTHHSPRANAARSTRTVLAILTLAALAGCGTSAAPIADPEAPAATAPAPDGGLGLPAPTSAPLEDGAAPADGASVTDAASPAANFALTGPHPVGKRDGSVSGNAVHCLFPSDSAPAAGFPGVVFAHGFQLAATGYDSLLAHLASYGYVVCSTDYPGNLLSIDHRRVGAAISGARAALAAGSVAGVPRVDPTRIAAAGHSLGGKGALMAILSDPAFVAGLAIDPVDGNPGNPLGGGVDAAHPQLAPSETAKLTVPMGYFGATQSRCSTGGFGASPCAPTTLDAAALYAATPAATPRHLWTVMDFGHMQFLDNPSCGFVCNACVAGASPADPRKIAVRGTAVAFLERHVRGESSAQPWLDGPVVAAHVTSGVFLGGTSKPPACP